MLHYSSYSYILPMKISQTDILVVILTRSMVDTNQLDAEKFSPMPYFSPSYPEELPYKYRNHETISVYFRADEDAVREFLPEPLEYVSNIVQAYISYTPEQQGGLEEYSEGGIVLQAEYDDITGGFVAAEYVTTDDALLCGREIWGYPKKTAEVSFEKGEEGISGSVRRKGTEILSVDFHPDDRDFERPQTLPRLQRRRIPKATEPGYDINQIVIMRFSGGDSDFDPDSIHTQESGTGSVNFKESEADPLYRLAPQETLGAMYTVDDLDLGYADEVVDL